MAVIQSTVEPDMQARILSLLWSISGGMAPLGLMISGPIADRVGIQSWFYLGGALCIFMGLVGLCIPAVMNIEVRRGGVLNELSTSTQIA
jgi:DHA3 family macrolide efflux protein-like MFS transporter